MGKESIRRKYSREISKITNRLLDLERGKIYDLTRTNGDPWLTTEVGNIRKDLDNLLDKIEHGDPSISDILRESLAQARKETRD
ncbi:hypothetical protein ABES25_04645 [Bacillus gobiensis]|uniref:hypothetical protein n=1 Tax=Bacillus gobiensis TaxID=1441095 RepID=UPI003D21D1FE